jgi:hypothetical protein
MATILAILTAFVILQLIQFPPETTVNGGHVSDEGEDGEISPDNDFNGGTMQSSALGSDPDNCNADVDFSWKRSGGSVGSKPFHWEWSYIGTKDDNFESGTIYMYKDLQVTYTLGKFKWFYFGVNEADITAIIVTVHQNGLNWLPATSTDAVDDSLFTVTRSTSTGTINIPNEWFNTHYKTDPALSDADPIYISTFFWSSDAPSSEWGDDWVRACTVRIRFSDTYTIPQSNFYWTKDRNFQTGTIDAGRKKHAFYFPYRQVPTGLSFLVKFRNLPTDEWTGPFTLDHTDGVMHATDTDSGLTSYFDGWRYLYIRYGPVYPSMIVNHDENTQTHVFKYKLQSGTSGNQAYIHSTVGTHWTSFGWTLEFGSSSLGNWHDVFTEEGLSDGIAPADRRSFIENYIYDMTATMSTASGTIPVSYNFVTEQSTPGNMYYRFNVRIPNSPYIPSTGMELEVRFSRKQQSISSFDASAVVRSTNLVDPGPGSGPAEFTLTLNNYRSLIEFWDGSTLAGDRLRMTISGRDLHPTEPQTPKIVDTNIVGITTPTTALLFDEKDSEYIGGKFFNEVTAPYPFVTFEIPETDRFHDYVYKVDLSFTQPDTSISEIKTVQVPLYALDGPPPPVPAGWLSSSNVYFNSTGNDIAYDGTNVHDQDGRFSLKVVTSGFSNVDYYTVAMWTSLSAAGYFYKNYSHVTPILDINALDFKSITSDTGNPGSSLFTGDRLDPDIYHFEITPYSIDTTGIYGDAPHPDGRYGDDTTETADQVASGRGVSIGVIDYRTTDAKFFGNVAGIGSSIAGNVLDTETGAVAVVPTNYDGVVGQYLDDEDPVILDIYYNDVYTSTMTDFDYLDDSFLPYEAQHPSIQDYTTYSTLMNRLKARNFDGSITSFPSYDRVIDGKYTYRARFNYELYGQTQSLTDLVLNIGTERTLTVEGSGTYTSKTGQFNLEWSPIQETFSSEMLDTSSLHYVVLYGKMGQVNPAVDFKSDLSQITNPNVRVLSLKNESSIAAYDIQNSGTTLALDDTDLWGYMGSSSKAFDDGDTYYITILPFYKIQTEWYHGEISDHVTVDIDKQLLVQTDVFPFVQVGSQINVYSQGNITFTATTAASGGGYANYVNLSWSYVGEVIQNVIAMDYQGTGVFTKTLNVFDTFSFPDDSVRIFVMFECNFTATVGSDAEEDVLLIIGNNNGFINIITGIEARITFIDPGAGGRLVIQDNESAEIVFGISTGTSSVAREFGVENYVVNESDTSILSVEFTGENSHVDIRPDIATSHGFVEHITGTPSWRIVINDLFQLHSIVRIDLAVEIDDGDVLMVLPATLIFYIEHAPNIVVTSPVVVLDGGSIAMTTRDTFEIGLFAYFGTQLQADSVTIKMTNSSGLQWTRTVTPLVIYYTTSIDPLSQWMDETIELLVTMTKGNIVETFSFDIRLNFTVVIDVDLSDFNYTVTDPEVNGLIDAWIPFTYPVTYNYYYIDFGTPIFKENYVVEREGDGEIIRFNIIDDSFPVIDDRNTNASSGAIEGLTGEYMPTAGDTDNLTFVINGPVLDNVNNGVFTENGTVFTQDFLLSSSLYFEDITFTVVPSWKPITHTDDERWNVTINGTLVNWTYDTSWNLVLHLDELEDDLDIQAVHYFYEEPPEPPEPTIIEQIIAFIVGIITFLLSLIGLAVAMTRKRSGRKKKIPCASSNRDCNI